ncbi:ELWxxDGT repeat protein [Archangium violaceum]|uniref:ELWxxDGT repeat protein n=1 Tax=Archangium violaceum TaxID=83451 RepID=UPI0036DE4065
MRLPASLRLLPLTLALGVACEGRPPPPEETPEGVQAAGASRTAEDTRNLTSPGESSRVEDLVPGQLSSGPHELKDVKGTLFFGATDVEHGTELWKSDGTPGGTRVVEDIRPGPAGSNLQNLTVAGRRVYFTADDGIHGTELWTSDGSRAGTRLVKDIFPGPERSFPTALTALDDVLYFTATTPAEGLLLWRTEGTPGSTRLRGHTLGSPFDLHPPCTHALHRASCSPRRDAVGH